MADTVSPQQFMEAEGVGDWRIVSDGGCAFFPVTSLEQAAEFVTAISALPGIADHQPDIDVRRDGVTVRLVTGRDDYFGMSQADVDSAHSISTVARALGLTADPSKVQSVLVVPGASNTAEILPFWQAVLGYVPRPDSPTEDLIDPGDRGPAFWFEQMNEPRADGGGAIHIAVWIPREQAEARVAAALAAGGRMVRDDFAPAWWTLADAAGNEADISTISGRQ